MSGAIVDTAFSRAAGAWGFATLEVLRQGVLLCSGTASDEVRITEMARPMNEVYAELITAISSATAPVAESATLGLRALAAVLIDVADELDDEAAA